jgi:hypothetical protein
MNLFPNEHHTYYYDKAVKLRDTLNLDPNLETIIVALFMLFYIGFIGYCFVLMFRHYFLTGHRKSR